ncbi:MAG TPA: UDP-N-acetylglucosamine 2-epimerase (non-hydrolyzing) [Rhodothermales bacterium]|nr:UDP-N-acetylglucosamine 2-epimerase (non-hydrolyzing) [Rhodothermales bacterium]
MAVRLVNVVGARPNLMKIAPLMKAYRQSDRFEPLLVHTGQHYDANMSSLFFEQLGIPRPDVNLGVGSGSQAEQTAAIMQAFEPVLLEYRPDAVVVVGDVNGTLACALVAAKLGIPVVHIEAGLRSFDRTMPEEINRILTDSVSHLLFCTEESAVKNLSHEGVDPDRVHLVGNLMIDALESHRRLAESSPILEDLGLSSRQYGLTTLHRPSNVDDPLVLGRILDALEEIGRDGPIVFPAHPRTVQRLDAFGFSERLSSSPAFILVEPLGYLEFLKLMAHATVVLTDSGGIQEETTVLGVPCLTLRENTERPITVTAGTNRIVGTDPAAILTAYRTSRSSQVQPIHPPLWDGSTAARITPILDAAYS